MIAAALMFILAVAQPDGERVMQDIQRSHIEANVPDRADFEKFVRRDLEAYFTQIRKEEDLPVELAMQPGSSVVLPRTSQRAEHPLTDST